MTTESGSTLSDGLGGAEPMIAPRAAAVPGSTIMLKRTADLGKVPQAANMADGEVFLNINTDSAALFVKGSGGEVRSLGGVQVASNAPTNPVEGLLWWDSANEILKLYTGGFFIELSDRSSGTDIDLQAVTDNGNTTTNGANFGGVLDLNSFDSAADKNATQISFGSVILQKASAAAATTAILQGNYGGSDNVTSQIKADGSALFGGGNITLNANGQGRFITSTNNVTVGSNVYHVGVATGESTQLISLGNDNTNKRSLIQFQTSSDLYIGSGTANIAEFKSNGNIHIGGGDDMDANPNITLNASGSASFADGNLTVSDSGRLECFDQNRVTSTQGYLARGTGVWPSSFAFRGYSDGVEKIVMGSGGNAWFADDVVIGGGTAFADPSITLNADGSAEFAGSVLINNPGFNDFAFQTQRTGDGNNIGGLRFLNASGTSQAGVYGYIGGRLGFLTDGNERLYINETGNVLIGGTLPASPNITLNANGVADVLRLNCNGGAGNENAIAVYTDATQATTKALITNQGAAKFAFSGSTPLAEIKTDGSATFAGDTTAGNVSSGIFSQLQKDGKVLVQRQDSTNRIWQGLDDAGITTSEILGNGSAKFAGAISSGTVSSSTPFGQVSPGSIQARPSGFSDLTFVGYAVSGADPVFSVDANGSGSFGQPGKGAFIGPQNVGNANQERGYISLNAGVNVNTDAACFSSYVNGVETIRFNSVGSATFAERIVSGSGTSSADSYGILAPGYVSVRDTGGETLWSGAQVNGSVTSYIKSDGSAFFAGDCVAGTYDAASTTTSGINQKVSGIVEIQRTGSTAGTALRIRQGTTENVSIRADGQATFAGDVTAANINTFRSNGESIDMMATLEKMALKLAELGANTADLFVAAPEVAAPEPEVDESETDEADS